jgi:hypothetical protein
MSLTDILLPEAVTASGVSRSKLTAFVPIALALIGIAAILLGGVTTHATNGQNAAAGVDPIVTGAIAARADQRRALQMLDD